MKRFIIHSTFTWSLLSSITVLAESPLQVTPTTSGVPVGARLQLIASGGNGTYSASKTSSIGSLSTNGSKIEFFYGSQISDATPACININVTSGKQSFSVPLVPEPGQFFWNMQLGNQYVNDVVQSLDGKDTFVFYGSTPYYAEAIALMDTNGNLTPNVMNFRGQYLGLDSGGNFVFEESGSKSTHTRCPIFSTMGDKDSHQSHASVDTYSTKISKYNSRTGAQVASASFDNLKRAILDPKTGEVYVFTTSSTDCEPFARLLESTHNSSYDELKNLAYTQQLGWSTLTRLGLHLEVLSTKSDFITSIKDFYVPDYWYDNSTDISYNSYGQINPWSVQMNRNPDWNLSFQLQATYQTQNLALPAETATGLTATPISAWGPTSLVTSDGRLIYATSTVQFSAPSDLAHCPGAPAADSGIILSIYDAKSGKLTGGKKIEGPGNSMSKSVSSIIELPGNRIAVLIKKYPEGVVPVKCYVGFRGDLSTYYPDPYPAMDLETVVLDDQYRVLWKNEFSATFPGSERLTLRSNGDLDVVGSFGSTLNKVYVFNTDAGTYTDQVLIPERLGRIDFKNGRTFSPTNVDPSKNQLLQDIYVIPSNSESGDFFDNNYQPVVPVIRSINPTISNSQGGTEIAIRVDNLLQCGGTRVLVGGKECRSSDGSAPKIDGQGVIHCVTPDLGFTQSVGLTGKKVKVAVFNYANRSDDSGSIVYANAPRLDSVSPSMGGTVGGIDLTLSGDQFDAGFVSVSIGSLNCPVLSSSLNQIQCRLPAGVAGVYDINVYNLRSRLSGSLAQGFTYLRDPLIKSVSPKYGNPLGGTEITLSGFNLAPIKTAAGIDLGGVPCAWISASMDGTSAKCLSGKHAAGIVSTTEKHDGGSGTLANSYTYTTQIQIDSLSPAAGSQKGGTSVTLTGFNLKPVSGFPAVTIAGANCTVTSVSADGTQLTCTTGAHPVGTGPAKVSHEGMSGTSSQTFSYTVH